MLQHPATQITAMLDSASQGHRAAADALLPLVYDQLRQLAQRHMAGQAPGLTLQPTALVHEAYLKLGAGNELKWESRRHFFAAAGIAMRHILVDRARRIAAEKHGGGERKRVTLDDTPVDTADNPIDWLALDEALSALERHDAELAEIVSLRYFAGLSIDDTAAALGVSPRSVDRLWQCAKAFLLRHMEGA